MSETPETDASASRLMCNVSSDFARKLKYERDEARRESLEQARLLGISGEWGCKLIAERDELQKKYDKLATENMLEVNKLCNQRDAAIDALMKIEDIFIDGDDTYEDWKSMGQIARTFLEKNT
jgi:hypothetical protein